MAVVILEQVRKYLEVVKPVPTQTKLEKSWYRTERGPSDKVLGVLVTDWFQRIKTIFFSFVSFWKGVIYKLVLFSWVPIPNIKVFIYFVDLNLEMN